MVLALEISWTLNKPRSVLIDLCNPDVYFLNVCQKAIHQVRSLASESLWYGLGQLVHVVDANDPTSPRGSPLGKIPPVGAA